MTALVATGPIAIVDIGSNSVRLVAYDRLSRAPVPIFNDKVLCGLGRGVVATGLLAIDAMARALTALKTFKILCGNLGVVEIHAVATAATRDARNGAEFLRAAAEAIGTRIQLVEGAREAELSALGVLSGFHDVDGVVGDMGGGSLELIDIRPKSFGMGVSLPLGGLSLLDASRDSLKRASRIARDHLGQAEPMKRLEGRSFFAVGGTWRALARLHMRHRGYSLNVMHGYVIPAADAMALGPLVERADAEAPGGVLAVPSARRPLLAYGAVVLEEIVRQGRPKEVVLSATGVREGILYERLAPDEQRHDPLLWSAGELNAQRSRSPGHGRDLCAWTDGFVTSLGAEEGREDRRLRHAACLLSDIAWRAHPDHRSEHALDAIAHGTFSGVDHPGRVFLALTIFYRHAGLDAEVGPPLKTLVTPALAERARLLGAALRIAYLLSAAMAGVLPRTDLAATRSKLALTLPADLAGLASDRCLSRLRQLAKLVGREAELKLA